MKFRKKPVEVEAVQLTALNSQRLASETGGSIIATFEGWHLSIPTLEGNMRAQPNDWIIKGVQGEFYPCKDDIFQKTYEPVLANGGYLNSGVVTPNEVRRRWDFNA